jgi:tetratricopeptide (TPR) repeat protein
MKVALGLRCGPLIVALLLILGGCADRLTKQQRVWLARGHEYYEREDFAQAIDHLSRFLGEVRDEPEVAQALYVRGMSQAKSGQRKQAYADLRRCVATPGDADTTWRAYVVLGTLHFEDWQWDRAAGALRAAAERMPTRQPKDWVLFHLGLCYERTGRWRAAPTPFYEITRTFPDGSYAEASRRRLRLHADHFAVQCGAFRVKENAETMRGNLARNGLDAYVRQEIRSRTPLYVVLVGRYATYEEASSQLATVREQFVSDALIWPG